MAKVIWTDAAIDDLKRIIMYISQDSIGNAKRLGERIFHKTDILTKFPESGRKVPEFNDDSIRELIESNYRIIYTFKKNAIWIARVHHSRRLITPL